MGLDLLYPGCKNGKCHDLGWESQGFKHGKCGKVWRKLEEGQNTFWGFGVGVCLIFYLFGLFSAFFDCIPTCFGFGIAMCNITRRAFRLQKICDV